MLNSPAPSNSSFSSDLPPMPSNPNIQQKPFEENPPKPSKTKLTFFALTFIILLIIVFFVWKNQYQIQQLELASSKTEQQASFPDNSSSAPKPSPSPSFLLQGKQSYSISQGDKTVPQITKAIINPLDPKLNETQTVQVKISHTSPVESVKLKLNSDNHQVETDMTLIEGTATNGTWEISWQITDTVLYNYLFTITAKSNDKTGSAGIAMRNTL